MGFPILVVETKIAFDTIIVLVCAILYNQQQELVIIDAPKWLLRLCNPPATPLHHAPVLKEHWGPSKVQGLSATMHPVLI